MTAAITLPNEQQSNGIRESIARNEPQALRTYTPTQAVFASSAGSCHFTPEGRRLFDYSSGVLVANLGHNPVRWQQRFFREMGWSEEVLRGDETGYFRAVTMTAYNAITSIEAKAVERLVGSLQRSEGGSRLEQVMWAASGSEAVQKALWACLHRDRNRDIILATRYGFHGKKGLAGAVTGSESDPDRDPRVRFISFPREEIADLDSDASQLDLEKYRAELDALAKELGSRINCLITEPYLGGGGSYHPPASYLQMLQAWCREHDVVFILDEIQANFGRTGRMYAFEKYGLEPDIVCLGKGMGNGVPVSAAVGRRDVFGSLTYGEGSDTWSANPLACAAVVATLDEFDEQQIVEKSQELSRRLQEGLLGLRESGGIRHVRGEGVVFGIECSERHGKSAAEIANAVVLEAYRGRGEVGVHLLGPLAGKVIRVSPPLTMTLDEADESLAILREAVERVAQGG